MGSPGREGLLTGATVLKDVKYPTLLLKWLTTPPLWVPQWSLESEKLHALKSLVKEQLAQGLHIHLQTI